MSAVQEMKDGVCVGRASALLSVLLQCIAHPLDVYHIVGVMSVKYVTDVLHH